MAFYQNSVLNKHLKGQDEKTVKASYQKFCAYFHNPIIQQNIRDAKEEQFQEGFLRELFVDILGYTLNPQPDFNLTTELKNEKGSKKADGAILHDGKALGVIELKGTDTKDLDKINVQAFNYKNNQTGCVYVITSNFEKLRFFIHDSVEHLEFNLFTLTESEFQLLWLCLSVENLLNGVPLKVKEESLHEEEKITKQLYKDYAAFRNDLWQNMVKNNGVADKLVLFKKTQKLLDRFLFILFAEDSGLLPPNSISRILKRWEVLKEEDAYKPLYDIFKQYFGYIDTGRKGQKTVDDIFAYNGGLFLPDALLDTILLDDDILHAHVLKLTKYDFQSEVDVNILGHIFENSLNEIESITAQLEGQELDKSKTKRKKDGVFYTPKYITKYIVENTVGKLCDEKKEALGIVDEEYAKGRKNRKKDIVKRLDANLQAYRNWLLNITICDPACGSGAFLNQALEFLMEEHTYIDELESQLLGHAFEFPGVENHILEKNIFGVDINEESVDIAKLSLWLRTAQRGRKLTSLNNNLKCGNSLIDDPSVAGDKAFNWEKEFPTVFEKGGFDVVIGNPPYGAKLPDEVKENLTVNYICFKENYDIYSAFIQLAFQLVKPNGFWGFINPVSWQSGEKYLVVRQYLEKNGKFEIGIKLPYDVFEDAYVDTGIYIVRKSNVENYDSQVFEFPVKFKYYGDLTTDINLKFLPSKYWVELDSLKIVLNPSFYELLPKMSKNTILLDDVTKSIRGILPNKQDVSIIPEPSDKKYFVGGLYRYVINRDFQGVHYGDHLKEKPKDYSFFQGERILIRRLINRQFQIMASFVNDEFVNKKDLYNLKVSNDRFDIKYLLAIINSKLISYLKIKGATTAAKDDFGQLTLSDIRQIPIKSIEKDNQQLFIDRVEQIINNKDELSALQYQFCALLQSKFEIEKLTTKLQNWHELEFKDFLKEFQKAKIKLSLSEEAEWMPYFNEQKHKAQALKSEIEKVDSEIDQMVYQLYGLTNEEIKIVES